MGMSVAAGEQRFRDVLSELMRAEFLLKSPETMVRRWGKARLVVEIIVLSSSSRVCCMFTTSVVKLIAIF